MSIQNSIDFIRLASSDEKFRYLLNGMNPDEIPETLKEIGYEFTAGEFEESINLLRFKCQFEEQAEQLDEVVTWFRILLSRN